MYVVLKYENTYECYMHSEHVTKTQRKLVTNSYLLVLNFLWQKTIPWE